MPVHQARTRSEESSEQSTTPVSTDQGPSNEAVLSQLSAGQLSWQGALGETLGSKLYEEISDKISEDELEQVAEKAVDSALSKLGGALKGRVDVSEQEAADLFMRMLDQELTRIATKAVSDSGVADAIGAFVDDHPYTVTAAALAGAIAYVLSNQKIGMIDSKVKLGSGHQLVAGVDLGRTMDIAIEKVRVGYRYSGGVNKAQLTADYVTEDDSWKVMGRYERALDGGNVALSGSHAQHTEDSRSRLDLTYSAGKADLGAWWQRDRQDGQGSVDTIGAKGSVSGEDWSAYVRGQGSSDGAWSSAAGFEKNKDDLSWGVEGYAGRTSSGDKDSGVRATLKWRF